MSGADIEPIVGNALPLSKIPLGLFIHNIEMQPGKGGQLVRGAGSSAQLMSREGAFAHIRLPSGETRMIDVRCMATVGQVGNLDHGSVSWGKAGKTRHRGIRPTVRGVAMNPVDHPMVLVAVILLRLGVNWPRPARRDTGESQVAGLF